MTSYVYFFHHKTLPIVKIGKANDWASRAMCVGGKEIIDFSKSMVKKVADSSAAIDLERMLHVVFEKFRHERLINLCGGTEWFKVEIMDDVKRMVRGLEKTDGSIVKSRVRPPPPRMELDIKNMTTAELLKLMADNCKTYSQNGLVNFVAENPLFEPHMNGIMSILTRSLKYQSLKAYEKKNRSDGFRISVVPTEESRLLTLDALGWPDDWRGNPKYDFRLAASPLQ